MKTEDFDDAVRRKVESINYDDYTSAEINKVHSYVTQKRFAVNRNRKFTFMVAASLLTALFSLITWNVVQLKQRVAMQATIDSLRTKVVASNTNNSIIKTDTVYINMNALLNDSKQTQKTNATVQKANDENVFSNKKETSKSYTLNNINDDKITTPTNYIDTNKEENNNKFLDVASLSSNTPILENSKEYETANSKNNVSEEAYDKTLQTANSEVQESDTSKITSEDILPIHESIRKPKLNLKSLEYRFGLSAEKANGQTGFGVMANVVFNKHWSANLGVKLLALNNEHFRDEDDFNHHRQQAFKNEYSMPIQDTALISNIGIKSSLLQIPISINYSIPIKNNVALYFGLGTDLDISGQQHVVYHKKQNASLGNYDGQESDKRINYKTSVLVFNNAVVTAGIQKNWNHVSLQFNPFISPQITSVRYKKERIYYGAKLALMYNF